MSTMTQVSDATDRITLRRRNDRRRRWLLAGIAALVVALLATAAWLVLGSDVLGVRTVAVSGNTITNTDDVRRLAELPTGTPLARVDLEGVATRVAGLPAVKTVKVAREWPNTVTVQITERSPLFAIETPGVTGSRTTRAWFKSSADADGLMVASVSNGDPRLIRDLGTVLSALPAGLRSRVDKVGADTVDSIVLYLPGGNRIVWGSADQSPLKAQVVVPLLKQQGTVHDVSAPSNPTVR